MSFVRSSLILMLFLHSCRIHAQNGNNLIANDSTQGQYNKLVLTKLLTNKRATLPAGRYFVDGNIELNTGVTLSGEGHKTELIMTSGTTNKSFFYISAVKSNIRLANLSINSNIAANSGKTVIALAVADRVSHVLLENCTFSGSRTYGCVQIKGTEDGISDSIQITNCSFTNAGSVALELRGVANVEIKNCVFANWASLYKNAPAIQLQSQKCDHVSIHHNQFQNTNGVQFAIESAGTPGFGNVSNASIHHNIFIDKLNLGGNGVSGYFTNSQFSFNQHKGGNGNQRSGYEIFGSNNIISHNVLEAGLIAISAGTVTNTNTSHVTISENHIVTKGKNSSGILIGAWTHLKTSNITVTKNYVDTRAASGNSSPVTIGFYGQRGVIDDIHVTNNTLFTNAESLPIRIEAAENSGTIFISGNKVNTKNLLNDVTHNTTILLQ